jgi:hypothetical protein
MGLRGDARINAEGLMYSVSDVSDKLEGYLAFFGRFKSRHSE